MQEAIKSYSPPPQYGFLPPPQALPPQNSPPQPPPLQNSPQQPPPQNSPPPPQRNSPPQPPPQNSPPSPQQNSPPQSPPPPYGFLALPQPPLQNSPPQPPPQNFPLQPPPQNSLPPPLQTFPLPPRLPPQYFPPQPPISRNYDDAKYNNCCFHVETGAKAFAILIIIYSIKTLFSDFWDIFSGSSLSGFKIVLIVESAMSIVFLTLVFVAQNKRNANYYIPYLILVTIRQALYLALIIKFVYDTILAKDRPISQTGRLYKGNYELLYHYKLHMLEVANTLFMFWVIHTMYRAYRYLKHECPR